MHLHLLLHLLHSHGVIKMLLDKSLLLIKPIVIVQQSQFRDILKMVAFGSGFHLSAAVVGKIESQKKLREISQNNLPCGLVHKVTLLFELAFGRGNLVATWKEEWIVWIVNYQFEIKNIGVVDKIIWNSCGDRIGLGLE